MRTYKKELLKNLVKYEKNARTHSKEQIQEIANSIDHFGFVNPILIDESNSILAGHGRYEAALKLKLNEVPVLVIEGLSDEQKRAYILADNKLALKADWDVGLLTDELTSLFDSGFNIELTGFSFDDINVDDQEELADVDEAVELDSAKEPVSVLGDVWVLGEHRLMCGDSTNAQHVDRLFGDRFAFLMVTDPPYGVKYEADWRAKAKGRKKTEREENSNLKNDDQADWYDAYTLFNGNVAYVWHASAFTDVVMDGLRRSGFEIKQQIIWAKNVHALSRSDYHWQHEPCWYAVKKTKERNWKGGRSQMTVWNVPSIVFEKDKTAHPTQKPVELFVRSINNHTDKNDYVYDPFGGSGTTAIACESTKRKALVMELDPKYCDLIIARYEKVTGKKAYREEDNGRETTS